MLITPRTPFRYLTLFHLMITSTNAAPQVSTTNTVNLRIECQNNTIFEGSIRSGPRIITIDGTSYPCNGLNNKANPFPGNTPTAALDAASKAYDFTYTGDFDVINNDFYIDKISTSTTRTATNVGWAILVNYVIPANPAGYTTEGCETECNKAGDDVLWAFITYDPITTTQQDVVFLKLAPAVLTVKKGTAFTLSVTNARTGVAVENATVGGVRMDVKGKATLSIPNKGFHQFKASRALPSVRSNVLNVTVT